MKCARHPSACPPTLGSVLFLETLLWQSGESWGCHITACEGPSKHTTTSTSRTLFYNGHCPFKSSQPPPPHPCSLPSTGSLSGAKFSHHHSQSSLQGRPRPLRVGLPQHTTTLGDAMRRHCQHWGAGDPLLSCQGCPLHCTACDSSGTACCCGPRTIQSKGVTNGTDLTQPSPLPPSPGPWPWEPFPS